MNRSSYIAMLVGMLIGLFALTNWAESNAPAYAQETWLKVQPKWEITKAAPVGEYRVWLENGEKTLKIVVERIVLRAPLTTQDTIKAGTLQTSVPFPAGLLPADGLIVKEVSIADQPRPAQLRITDTKDRQWKLSYREEMGSPVIELEPWK